jgi:hypothetical protein
MIAWNRLTISSAIKNYYFYGNLFRMTVTINKKEKLEAALAKLERLEASSKIRKSKSFAELSGSLAHLFKGDPVKIQRKLRKEWDR